MISSFPSLRSRARWAMATAVVVLAAGYAHTRPAPGVASGEVSVGYGTQNPLELTQAVESVVPDEPGNVKVGRVEELLQGRLSGVQVLRTPDGGFSVRIRGTGSVSQQREPLYVVDGMPVRVAPGHGLTWLNPADVARIDVLKGAAAGVYGWSGANGVILITTRR